MPVGRDGDQLVPGAAPEFQYAPALPIGVGPIEVDCGPATREHQVVQPRVRVELPDQRTGICHRISIHDEILRASRVQRQTDFRARRSHGNDGRRHDPTDNERTPPGHQIRRESRQRSWKIGWMQGDTRLITVSLKVDYAWSNAPDSMRQDSCVQTSYSCEAPVP